MNEIKIEDILKDAWNGFKENWQQLLLMSALVLLLPMIICIGLMYGGIFAMAASHQSGGAVFALMGVLYLVLLAVMIVGTGFYKVSFLIYQGKKVQFSDIWMSMGTYLKVLGLFIIMLLGVGLGSILCVLPGLAVAFFFSLSINILIEDSNKGVIDAIKESCSLVKANWQPVLFSMLICMLVNAALGSTGIGSIISMPAMTLITTALYLRIKNQNKDSGVSEVSELMQ